MEFRRHHNLLYVSQAQLLLQIAFPEDKISMADKDLAQITGFLTTIFKRDVPSFILLVTAATAAKTLIESN